MGIAGCHVFGNGQPVVDPCKDHVRDGDETDIDCGGNTCLACLPDGACRVDGDCQSHVCLAGMCEAASGPPFWLPVAQLPTAREDLSVAGVDADGRIYAVGGRDASGPLATVEAYDPKTNTWSLAPSLTTARSGLGASLGGNGALYAIGGATANGPSAAVEQLIAGASAWSPAAPLATARTGLAVGHSEGLILAVGGDAAGTAEAFDLSRWTARPPMPTPRTAFGFGPPFGNDQPLFAVGGRVPGGAVSTVEAFHVKANQWVTAEPLSTARYGLAASPGGDGRLWAIGGTDGTTELATAEAYSSKAGRWSKLPPLALARHGLAACLGSDGRLYAVGGATASGPVDMVEAYGPRVTLNPSTASPGDLITVSGDNFAANALVFVGLGNDTQVHTDENGVLHPVLVTLEQNAQPGQREVDVIDLASAFGAKVFLTVR
jgi:hypothetical protein